MKQLKTYEPILSEIMLKLARETSFSSKPGLAKILEENPRLVIAFNHATPISWLPAVSLLTAHVCARGGGNRVPMGVMDRFFYAIPGVRALAALITQSERVLGFDELTEKFKRSEGTDLVLFPEGSNCFFGSPEELQPFRSPRFVELAIRTETPILLCAHRGSEGWAKALPVPQELLEKLDVLPKMVSDFLGARLKQTGLFTLPLLPKPMERFVMRCELYRPALQANDLSDDKDTCADQVREQAALIHAKLQEMLDEIDSSSQLSGGDSSVPNS